MQKPLLIGIAGGSGSGKTTLTKQLTQKFGTEVVSSISQDAFYKDLSTYGKEIREQWNFDHPDAIDWQGMLSVLQSLTMNNSVTIPQYDFCSHTRSGHEEVHPTNVIIVEGHLILSKQEIAQLFDYKVFLELDIDLLFIRRLQRDRIARKRDTGSICQQYLETVRPALFEHVIPSGALADIIINLEDETEWSQPIIKIIWHHLATLDEKRRSSNSQR